MPSYHSAHLLPVVAAPAVDRWEGPDGSTAFVHDLIMGELPSEYDACDVLYADLPWRAGFQTFNDRAGVHDGRTYAQFMDAVGRLVTTVNRPTVLVSGKHALRYLPEPAQTFATRMDGTGQDALAILYNFATFDDWTVAPFGLLGHLARIYGRVGDFCCGYGNALRAFAERGKPFVGSDVNPACVGYVAEHAPVWSKANA